MTPLNSRCFTASGATCSRIWCATAGVRVYIPFGTEWYPYFMRRLGERPANVFFIARHMLRP